MATEDGQKLSDEFKREIGAFKEDIDHKLDAVLEYVKDVPNIAEKQDMMFETIGNMAEDVTIIKESVKDHEVRLQKLEMK